MRLIHDRASSIFRQNSRSRTKHIYAPVLLSVIYLVSSNKKCSCFVPRSGDVEKTGTFQDFGSDPSAKLRKTTADDILRIISGYPLEDPIWERQLSNALYVLPFSPSPPAVWQKLQRDTFKYGRSALSASLSNDSYPVPDVEGSKECRCQLTSKLEGQRFGADTLNGFMTDLFHAIPQGFNSLSFPMVKLSRYDLFHAHLFMTANKSVGLLFHAQEYPAYQNDTFAVNLGYCQQNSTLEFSQAAMDIRNILWFQDELIVLDVGEASILYESLLMDGVQDVRTVNEGDFGARIFDINYFDELHDRAPNLRTFIC